MPTRSRSAGGTRNHSGRDGAKRSRRGTIGPVKRVASRAGGRSLVAYGASEIHPRLARPSLARGGDRYRRPRRRRAGRRRRSLTRSFRCSHLASRSSRMRMKRAARRGRRCRPPCDPGPRRRRVRPSTDVPVSPNRPSSPGSPRHSTRRSTPSCRAWEDRSIPSPPSIERACSRLSSLCWPMTCFARLSPRARADALPRRRRAPGRSPPCSGGSRAAVADRRQRPGRLPRALAR